MNDRGSMMIQTLWTLNRKGYYDYKTKKTMWLNAEKIELRERYKASDEDGKKEILKRVKTIDSYFKLFADIEAQGELFNKPPQLPEHAM